MEWNSTLWKWNGMEFDFWKWNGMEFDLWKWKLRFDWKMEFHWKWNSIGNGIPLENGISMEMEFYWKMELTTLESRVTLNISSKGRRHCGQPTNGLQSDRRIAIKIVKSNLYLKF